jgi:hypothetical protein
MKFTEHYFKENDITTNPMVVYHGSKNAGFSVFDRSKSRSGKLNTMGSLT